MQWLIAFIFFALILLYIFVIRPVLVAAPVLSAAFKREASLLDCVRVRLLGFKTKIVARLFGLGGLLIGIYPIAMGQDWTPITKMLPDWSLPVLMVAVMFIFEKLRKVTENPPQVVVQKMDDGTPQVVAMIKPPAA